MAALEAHSSLGCVVTFHFTSKGFLVLMMESAESRWRGGGDGEGGVQQRAATAEGNTKIFHCLHLNVVLVICFVVAVCLLSCSFHS